LSFTLASLAAAQTGELTGDDTLTSDVDVPDGLTGDDVADFFDSVNILEVDDDDGEEEPVDGDDGGEEEEEGDPVATETNNPCYLKGGPDDEVLK